MAINNCSPVRIYGSYRQFLFLGLSVQSFSASIGWGDSPSQLTVNLVEDVCSHDKLYLNENLEIQTWTGPDPGLTTDLLGVTWMAGQSELGCPVLFKYEDFEFCGLIQRVERTYDVRGIVYTVTIVDPKTLLDSTKVITNDYAGSVFGSASLQPTNNIINVYGFAEDVLGTCDPMSAWSSSIENYPDPPNFAGAFGGAYANNLGMPWVTVKDAITLLTCRVNPSIFDVYNKFCNNGRVTFKGTNKIGMGYLGGDIFDPITGSWRTGYAIDISELPIGTVLEGYNMRVGSNGITSLLEIISDAAFQLGYDYYVELNPVIYNGEILKVIKVRGVSKREAIRLSTDSISDFATAHTEVLSFSKGEELRNEVTSAFLIGGNRRDLIERDSNYIQPYWGTDVNGNLNLGAGNGDDHSFTMNIAYMGLTDKDSNPILAIDITVGELRSAMISQDLWLSYHANKQTGLAIAFNLVPTFQLNNAALTTFINNATPKLPIDVFKNAFQQNIDMRSKFVELDRIYQFVKNIAEEYYGKRYLVEIPQTCVEAIADEARLRSSHEISQEGGWPLPELSVNAGVLTLFRTDDGLIKSFVRIDAETEIDWVNLNPQDFYYDSVNGIFYMECDMLGIFYENNTTKTGPHVAISLRSKIPLKRTLSGSFVIEGLVEAIHQQQNAAGGGLTKAQTRTRIQNCMRNGVMFPTINEPLGYEFAAPDYAYVAIRNNVLTYGPWSSQDIPDPNYIIVNAISVKPGNVHVEKDESLVPWNFNSENLMNAFAIMKARDLTTMIQEVEVGTVTVAGWPQLPLGQELLATSPAGVANRFINTFVDSTTSINYFSLPILSNNGLPIYNGDGFTGWNGYYGPNITSVEVQFGTDGITTIYGMRTYTAQINDHLSKAVLERFRNIGRFNLYTNNQIRDFIKFLGDQRATTQLEKLRAISPQGGGGGGGFFNIKDDISMGHRHNRGVSTARGNTNPHEVLVGALCVSTTDDTEEFGEGTPESLISIINVGSVDIATAKTDLDPGTTFAARALAGWDTLFRPVTIPGDYEAYTLSASLFPKYADGFDPSGASGVNAYSMNPFWGAGYPGSGYDHIYGHDMGWVNMGDSGGDYSESGFNSILTATDSAYAPLYNVMALRGPLVVAGWGFDTAGLPVPNESGDSGGSQNFVHNWLHKYHTWKVGPVDLRWDYARHMWVAGGSNVILAKLNQHLGADQDEEPITDPDIQGATLIDYDGTESDTIVPVTNCLGHPIASGTKVYITNDTSKGTYLILRAEHKPVCVITHIDCYVDVDNVNRLKICSRQLWLDSGWTTQSCDDDDPATNNAQTCGSGEFDFDDTVGALPSIPGGVSSTGTNGIGINVNFYGITGDGVTDVTTSIQDVIDLIETLPNGGTIYFPQGTYLTSRQSPQGAFNYNLIVTADNVRFYGEGKSSIIKTTGATPGTIISTSTTGTISNLSIENLTLDGSAADITWGWENYEETGPSITNEGNAVAGIEDQHAIGLYGAVNASIRNVNIYNVGMDGIHISDCSGVTIDANTSVTRTGKDNIYILASRDIRIIGTILEDANYSPDDGATKDYFYTNSSGHSAIHIEDIPGDSINKVLIDGVIINTTTGRGITLINPVNSVTIVNSFIKSNTRTNTILDGRHLISVYNPSGYDSGPCTIANNHFINLDTNHDLAVSIYIQDMDDIDFHDNIIDGGTHNELYYCDSLSFESNKIFNTTNVTGAIHIIGSGVDSESSFLNIRSNYIHDATGVGFYMQYINSSHISDNIFTALTEVDLSGAIYLDGVLYSEINENTYMGGAGVVISTSGSASGCIIANNMALSHGMSEQDMIDNLAHHNIPGVYNSSNNLGLGLEESGVAFGNNMGGLDQNTTYFYWDDNNLSLFANEMETNGMILRASDSSRYIITVLPDGRLQAECV